MICDVCVNLIYKPAGSFHSVTEGMDDPYGYWYCAKGHWSGDFDQIENEEIDPWKDCEDFDEEKKRR